MSKSVHFMTRSSTDGLALSGSHYLRLRPFGLALRSLRSCHISKRFHESTIFAELLGAFPEPAMVRLKACMNGLVQKRMVSFEPIHEPFVYFLELGRFDEERSIKRFFNCNAWIGNDALHRFQQIFDVARRGTAE